MIDIRYQFEQYVNEERYLEAYELLLTHPIDDSYDPFYCSSMCWVLNQLERYHEAKYYARKGIGLFPNEGFLHAQLGYAYYRNENDDAALASYRKALELKFDDAWVFGDIGSILQDRSQFEEALDHYESGLLEEVNHTFCLLGAASCYVALQKYDIAIEYYEKVYMNEGDPSALYELICTCSEANQYQKALMYLEEMNHPRYERWKLMESGIIYFRLGHPQRALKYFNQVIEIQPDMDVYKMMTRCFQSIGDRHKMNEYANMVIELLEAQLKLSKADEKVAIIQELASYSECLLDQNVHIRYLNQAKEVGIDEALLWPYYAHAYVQLDDYHTALKYCELLYENKQHSEFLLDIYSWLLRVTHQNQLAIKILDEYIELCGESKRNLEELVLNELILNRFSDALNTSQKLFQMDENDWRAYYYMAWSFYSLERHDEAIRMISQVEQLSYPESYTYHIYELKGNILAELGQHQESFEAYEKAYLYQEDGELNA